MKSREKTTELSQKVALKNYMRMQLLAMRTDFQNDVLAARKKFGIPSGGFSGTEDDDPEKRAVALKRIVAWATKRRFLYDGIDPEGFNGGKPVVNPFRDEMERIGKRYGLPLNFYYSFNAGVAPYLLRNRISILNQNWEVFQPILDDRYKAPWVALRLFGKLTSEEAKDALKELSRRQELLMTDSVRINMREKKNLERDFRILEYVSNRTHLPRKIKEYRGYLSYMAKDVARGATSKKELKKWERVHPTQVEVVHDNPLIRDVARNFKISPDAARQSIRRLQEASLEMFGKPLELKS